MPAAWRASRMEVPCATLRVVSTSVPWKRISMRRRPNIMLMTVAHEHRSEPRSHSPVLRWIRTTVPWTRGFKSLSRRSQSHIERIMGCGHFLYEVVLDLGSHGLKFAP